MNLREFDITHRYPATVLSSDRITPRECDAEVRHIVLQMPEGAFHYVEGQSVGVLAPGPHPFGNAHHLRLYSIASARCGEEGQVNTLSLCVRRCFYIDDVNGERYPGRASNYLCDAKPGDIIPVTGPYGVRFHVPADETSNLLMVGAGTGIAPFRAFCQYIYNERKGWSGRVRLFYGAKVGMEALYMNDFNRDLGLYYNEKSFRAFESLSPRPAFDVPPEIDRALIQNSYEVWELVQNPKTYVYLAGLTDAARKFEKAMAVAAGGAEDWHEVRDELIAQGRLQQLLYD